MRIAEVARRSGVPATTLRYYEDLGLLEADRAENGYRSFDQETLERLRFIGAAKRLKLPLPEIAALLAVWRSDPCVSVKGTLRPLLDAQLAEIDRGLSDLSGLRDRLSAAVRHLGELPDRDERCDPDCAFLDLPGPSPAPVVCSLGSRQGERLDQWHQLLEGATVNRYGWGARIDLPTSGLDRVCMIAVAEHECCPFFGFEFALHGPRFTLTIRTPPDGIAMLDELLGRSDRPDPDLPDSESVDRSQSRS